MDSDAIIGAVTAVTRKWEKQRKAEEKHSAREGRRRAELTRSYRQTIRAAAWDGMEAAYLKASSGGTLPAHARQVMYAARPAIQECTGKQLDDQYFTQTLLPDYMRENVDQTLGWDVVYDARGHFAEPHTGVVVPLGTLNVRRYLRDVADHAIAPATIASAGAGAFPTKGPRDRFGAILFIEKEGFVEIFKAARLAERFDVALMSTKGMSVTASRLLIDELSDGVPLLVLRDFDKSGFSIVGTLMRDTRRYEFTNLVEVVDLGLRLDDVIAHDLEVEAEYHRSDPTWNLRENGATDAEIEFLRGYFCYPSRYEGRRVELNAFTSGDLVRWIESKLEAYGVAKVVPDAATIEAAYRRALHQELLHQEFERINERVRRRVEQAELPAGLTVDVRARLEEDPTQPWDSVVADIAAGALSGEGAP